MRLLLDTHTLLWLMLEPERLSAKVHVLLADPANLLLVSIASLWELAIKVSLPNNDLPVSNVTVITDSLDAFHIQILPIKPAHLQALQRLPLHHRDPFDRILIAQSQVEQLPLLSVDRYIRSYEVDVHW